MTETNDNKMTNRILVNVLIFMLGVTLTLGFSQLTLGNAVARHEVQISNLSENQKETLNLMKELIKKLPEPK